MSLKSILIAASLAVLVLGLGLGGFTLRKRNEIRIALGQLSEEQGRSEARLQQEREAGARRRREQMALAAKPARTARGPRDVGRSSGGPGAADIKPIDRSANFNRAIERHADVRALALKAFRANLVVRFGEMYKSLGLTSEQIEKFEDMATAHEDDRETLYAAAAQQGLDPAAGNVLVLHDQYMNQYYASLGIDLSPAVEAAVQQLDSERNRVGPLQSVVEAADMTIDVDATPYSGRQRSDLVRMLAGLSPSYQAGGSADVDSVDWTAARTQAATILSGAQLQAFDAQVQMMLLQRKLGGTIGQSVVK